VMVADQASLGVQGVEVKRMSWADDWDAFGVGENSVDVAIASRSIATDDLQDSLLKLTRVARRRACITLPCSSSPRVDNRLLEAAGLAAYVGYDFVYAINILIANGLRPEVNYIGSTREETFDSVEQAHEKLWRIVEGAAQGFASESELEQAKVNLDAWIDANLVANSRAGESDDHGVVQGAYRLAQARTITWAFIAWSTE